MPKQTIENQQETKKQQKNKQDIVIEQIEEQIQLARLSGFPIAGSGQASIQTSAAQLSDKRFQTAQQQAMASQIGRLYGNQYLQRVIAQTKQAKPQTEGGLSNHTIQRNFPAPAPSPPAPVQAELTPGQITTAISFNQSRYDDRNTRLIQDLVGTAPTGTWNEGTILLIAQFQDQHGVQKDGKVGVETFRLLDAEQATKGAGTSTAESLLSFKTPEGNVTPFYKNIGGHHFIQGEFKVEAQFSERGNCGDWEYRQEIKGNAWGQKPGFAKTNLNHFFTFLPFGRLDPNWHEDGNTNWQGSHYGHRQEPGRASQPINRYEDHQGNPDQQNGCIYKGEDAPKVTDVALASGDTLTLELEFAGGIYRRDPASGNLVVVTRKTWTINGSIIVP